MSDQTKETITAKDVAKVEDVLGFQVKFNCAGPKVERSKQWLEDQIESLLVGAEKGMVRLTDAQAAQLKATAVEGAPGLFDIGGVFGLGADGQAFERVPCGIDVTDLINAVPVDGEVHEVACPKCRTIATVRRVPSDNLSAEAEDAKS
jgi:hypothetical protein